MKFKDYFATLRDQGKIKNEAYDKFLETVPDGEIPDDIFKTLDTSFMTLDRALTHKEVHGKIMRETLDVIDRDIQQMLKILPAEKVLDIERETNTFKKMGLVRDALPEALAKAAKAPNDEEAKKKIEALNAINHELTEKFNKFTATHQEEIKKVKDESEKDKRSYILNAELEKRANLYTFADVYKDTRPALTKAHLGEILATNKLDLIEQNGSFDIAVLDENGKPRFDGNTPVSITSLMDAKFKPYLKQNNSDGGGQNQNNNGNPPKKFTVDNGRPGPRGGANVSVQV